MSIKEYLIIVSLILVILSILTINVLYIMLAVQTIGQRSITSKETDEERK